MADKKHLNEFATHQQYENYISTDIPLSNVCLCEEDNRKTYYHPWIGVVAKFKATDYPVIYIDDFPLSIAENEYDGDYENFLYYYVEHLELCNKYKYTGETFEYDGDEYYLWERDDEYDDVHYLLTKDFDYSGNTIEYDIQQGGMDWEGFYLNTDEEETYSARDREDYIVAQRGGLCAYLMNNNFARQNGPIKNMIVNGVEQEQIVTRFLFDDLGEIYVRYTLKDNTVLPAHMFSYTDNLLNEVRLPNTITTIENNAFCGDLEKIIIPKSVTTMGDGVFSGCKKLEQIVIPDSVTTIGERMFANCESLKIIKLSQNLTSIKKGMFSYCNSLISVEYDNDNSNVKLTNNIKTLEDSAFRNCINLTSVKIPNTITSIGETVFAGCVNLSSIIVEENNPNYDSRNNCNAIIRTASNTLKQGCKNTVIPNTVTTIGEYAFRDLTDITSVGDDENYDIKIPNSVRTLEVGCFYGCSDLSTVKIPNSVIRIKSHVFRECPLLPVINGIRYADTCLVKVVDKTLSSYSIEQNTRFIDTDAFSRCKNFTSITIPAAVIDINDEVFDECDALGTIVVDSNNTVYDSRNNCNAIIRTSSNTLIEGCKNTIIPNTVKTIGKSAFLNRKTLTNIEIPNSVTSISNNAFYNCTSLTTITIPDSVISINPNVFRGCSGLTSVTIGSGLTSLAQDAFSGCTSLTSITIPNTITSIGSGAFYGCSKLATVTISENINNISSDAFCSCRNLESVTILATTPPSIGTDVFKTNKSGRKIYVPSASVNAYKTASGWSEYASSIYAITE